MAHLSRNYGSSEYWEARYQRDNSLFDWYFDYNEFFEKNIETLDIKPPVLVVGCGNSDLSMNLEKSGVYPVISTDISPTCCRKMADRTGGCYLPMDVCKLQFRDNSFPCVIDKGTLDAILCQSHYEISVTKMICEIARVLAPNGVFIEVTFGKTAEKLNILDSPDLLPWSLETIHKVENESGIANIFVFRKFLEVHGINPKNRLFYLYNDESSEEESDNDEDEGQQN
ncbi:Protein kinase domain containing protein [Tritrichomonas foetus]|uniref:Protein kinase domain containing protein n=1 Tax=Tritrichomonas foetus TaxID=1144522 RepID=A0A1J4J9H3_9EUKA|nr:Protein kinase domain containing protein [Tritrichomonas foetus]|eukprot:OHS95800.1 Protein kinase domain containing protein [Tritrichomonas foetus]